MLLFYCYSFKISIIALSTISQISHMFIALLINPILCFYHIIYYILPLYSFDFYLLYYLKCCILYYCNYLSLSSNLIYGIHCSYYSILISLSIENLFLICWLHFWYYYSDILPYIYFTFYYIPYSTLFTFLLLLLWLSIIIWLNDLFIEAFIALTIIEQLALTLGIKLLLLSELMLFFACFWCYINFRLIGSVLFIFNLLSIEYLVVFNNLEAFYYLDLTLLFQHLLLLFLLELKY